LVAVSVQFGGVFPGRYAYGRCFCFVAFASFCVSCASLASLIQKK